MENNNGYDRDDDDDDDDDLNKGNPLLADEQLDDSDNDKDKRFIIPAEAKLEDVIAHNRHEQVRNNVIQNFETFYYDSDEYPEPLPLFQMMNTDNAPYDPILNNEGSNPEGKLLLLLYHFDLAQTQIVLFIFIYII